MPNQLVAFSSILGVQKNSGESDYVTNKSYSSLLYKGLGFHLAGVDPDSGNEDLFGQGDGVPGPRGPVGDGSPQVCVVPVEGRLDREGVDVPRGSKVAIQLGSLIDHLARSKIFNDQH